MAQKKSRYRWEYNKMMALVRGLDFENIQQYYDYIEESKINGNLDQVKTLFRDMPKYNRKDFLSYLADDSHKGNKNSYALLKLLIEEI